MDRREAFMATGLAALAAAGVSQLAMADDDMAAHHHGSSALALAASDCVVKGEVCQAHCLDLLGDGDKDLADCAHTVAQVLTLCSALQSLAAQKSHLLPALARITGEACEACAKECEKHSKHEPCKACGEACKACLKECKQVSA